MFLGLHLHIRSCRQRRSLPSTRRLCVTPAAWLLPRPPIQWLADSSCSRPKRWPTPRPTLSKPSRSTPQAIKMLSVNLFYFWTDEKLLPEEPILASVNAGSRFRARIRIFRKRTETGAALPRRRSWRLLKTCPPLPTTPSSQASRRRSATRCSSFLHASFSFKSPKNRVLSSIFKR